MFLELFLNTSHNLFFSCSQNRELANLACRLYDFVCSCVVPVAEVTNFHEFFWWSCHDFSC